MEGKELDEMFSYFENNPGEVDKLGPEEIQRFGQLKEQRMSKQKPVQGPAQEMNPVGSGATGGPAGNYAANQGPDLAAEDKRNQAGFANTSRSMLAGATADLNTGIARATGDKEAEAGAKADPVARGIGMMMSPLNKIGGGSVTGAALNNIGQAAVSGLMRGVNLDQGLVETGVAAGASLLPPALGYAMKKTGIKVPRWMQSEEHLATQPTQAQQFAEGIEEMPQEAVNEAFASIMRHEDPTLVANILRNDPNYAREVVKQYNLGRPSTTSVSPVDQMSRTIKNVDDARALQLEAEKPLTFSNPPISAVEAPLQSRVDNLTKGGRADEISRLLEELRVVREARAAQDMGRSGAAMKSGANPMQRDPAGLEIPPDGQVSGEIGRGVSEMTPGSVPVVDPVTASKAQSVMSATDANTSYPARNIPDRMRAVIKQGRENSMTKGPSEKGVLGAEYYETVQGLEDSLRNVTDKGTADNVLNSMQVGKAADEAHTASVHSLQGGRSDIKTSGLGAAGSLAHSVSAPISARWAAWNQNRTVDKAIAKMNESLNPQMQQLAQWIQSAGSPTGVAARSFVAAKQSPEFLKAIQEGDDNDGK